MGRGNWLFFGSDRGGRTAAILLTLLKSAQRNDLNLFDYPTDVFTRIADHPKSRIAELLPHRWKPASAEHDLVAVGGHLKMPQLWTLQSAPLWAGYFLGDKGDRSVISVPAGLPEGKRNADRLAITFTRRKHAPHIEYVVEVCDAMKNWQSGPEHTEEVLAIDQGATEKVTVRDRTPISGSYRRFIRLLVRPK